MKRVALVLALVTLIGVSGVRANGSEAAGGHRVAVLVKDAAGAFNIPRAHVRLVSEAGATLAKATSGPDGIAYLAVTEEKRPARILVEAQGYYIGGLKWRPGAREVFIHLALLRTCDFSVVAPAK